MKIEDDNELSQGNNEQELQEKQSKYFPDKTKIKLSFFAKKERLMIVGKTRMGKTYFVRKLIKMLKSKVLIIVLDVKNEYSDLKELDEKILLNSQSRGLYRLTHLNYPDTDEEIHDPYYLNEFICRNMFERGNCLLVCEEVASYIGKYGKLYDIAPEFARYLQQGQARNCGLICTSQRPAEVHTNILSQSQHIISFFMKLEHDQKALRNYFDPSLFAELAEYEFLRFSDPDRIYLHYRIY